MQIKKMKYGPLKNSKLNLFVFLLLICGFALILIPHQNSAKAQYRCDSISNCNKTDIRNNSSLFESNIDLTLIVTRTPNSFQKREGTNSYPQILATINNDEIVVGIPMRFGTGQRFNIPMKLDQLTNKIDIVIEQSRKFVITINNKLAYTHHYQSPVFFVDPVTPVLIDYQTSDYVISIKTNSLSLQEMNNDHKLFLFGNFLIAGSILLFYLFPIYQRVRKKKNSVHQNILYLYIIIWATTASISLSNFYMGSKDLTGVNSLSPFGPVGPIFSDYFQLTSAADVEDPFSLRATTYPPFAILIIKLFNVFPAYIGFTVIFSMFTVFFIRQLISAAEIESVSLSLLAMSLFSYPLISAIVRGNLDLIVVVMLWQAIRAIETNKSAQAILYLSIAISLKLWPLVFLLLLIKNRRIWQCLAVVASSTAITLASFAVIFPSKIVTYLATFLDNSDFYLREITPDAGAYSFSITGMAIAGYLFVREFGVGKQTFALPLSEQNLMIYLPVLNVLVLSVLIFGFFFSRRKSGELLFLASICLLIPSSSHVYRALILIYVLYVRLKEDAALNEVFDSQKKSFAHKFIQTLEVMSWSIILAPTSFYYFATTSIGVSSILQPTSLCVLCALEFYKRNRSYSLNLNS